MVFGETDAAPGVVVDIVHLEQNKNSTNKRMRNVDSCVFLKIPTACWSHVGQYADAHDIISVEKTSPACLVVSDTMRWGFVVTSTSTHGVHKPGWYRMAEKVLEDNGSHRGLISGSTSLVKWLRQHYDNHVELRAVASEFIMRRSLISITRPSTERSIMGSYVTPNPRVAIMGSYALHSCLPSAHKTIGRWYPSDVDVFIRQPDGSIKGRILCQTIVRWLGCLRCMGLIGDKYAVHTDMNLAENSFPRELLHEYDEYSASELSEHRNKVINMLAQYNRLIATDDTMDPTEWVARLFSMTEDLITMSFNSEYGSFVIGFDISTIQARIQKIQFILVTDSDKASFGQILAGFDISVCKVGMVISKNGDPSFIFGKKAKRDIENVVFRSTSTASRSKKTMIRIAKYVNRGFAHYKT